jgi:hypothetical protein
VLAPVVFSEERVRVGGLGFLVTLCALGCAASIPHVEPRPKSPDASIGSDANIDSAAGFGSDANIDSAAGFGSGANIDSAAGFDSDGNIDSAAGLDSDASTVSDAESIQTVTDYPPPIAIPEIRLPVFGSVTTDAEGRLSILPANEIRNAENEMYGWRIWVGRTSEPVQWTERLTAPVGVEMAGGRDVNISDDRRTIEFANAMVPEQGFIFSQWALGADEAPGRYEIAVELPDDRIEKFSFTLGHPEDACPAMKILLNWWRAKHSLEGDPGNRDVSDRVLGVFGTRLARHGFVAADLEDAYWYVMASAARRSDDREVAYGHIVMRAIADFQGKARRYSSTTNFTGRIDYGILFDSPVSGLDEFVRTLADRFAAVLLPHAREACADWWSGQLEEEARLKEIRIQLEEEINRVRRRRAENEKRLELEVDP